MSETGGPTTSPQTNLLISLCEQAMQQGPSDRLLEVLHSRQQGLDQAKMDFVSKVQEQGDQYMQLFHKEIEDVISAFDGYREGLLDIRGWLEKRDNSRMQRAIETLTEVTPQLVAALDAYEARFMVVGPSQYPIVNIWGRIAESARKGQLPRESLLAMIAGARDFFSKCVKELDNCPDAGVDHALQHLREGYEMFLSALNQFEAFAGDQAANRLDSGMELVSKAHESMQVGFDEYREATLTGRPTRSMLANAVINAAPRVAQGRITWELFEKTLKTLEDHFNSMKQGVEGLATINTDSHAIKDLIPRVLEAFDLHLEATTQLRRYGSSQNSRDLEEGAAKLTEAANAIAQYEDEFKKIGELEGKIPCVRCGHPNEVTLRTCQKCNAQLPRTMESAASTLQVGEGGSVDGMVVSEHVKRLIEDTNAVADGQLSKSDYMTTLNWLHGMLDAAEREAHEVSSLHPESFDTEDREAAYEAQNMVEQTREMLLAAIRDYRDGLNELARFVQDDNRDHLVQGLRTVFPASQAIYKVQQIGSDAQARVAESEAMESGGETASSRIGEHIL